MLELMDIQEKKPAGPVRPYGLSEAQSRKRRERREVVQRRRLARRKASEEAKHLHLGEIW